LKKEKFSEETGKSRSGGRGEEGRNLKRKKRGKAPIFFIFIGGRVDKGGLAPYLEKGLIQNKFFIF